ncbi:MAG: PhzF family phenazine biosynthesis protein, partial [Gammaproteobacteria bacterium]
MQYTYYTADVFTNVVFQGAQIAVLPQANDLSDERMALIAAEINLSETVFVTGSDRAGHFRLRIFTPRGEIDFAGHPILATARALIEAGMIDVSANSQALTFSQNTGDISVDVARPQDKPVFVQFSLRASPVVDRYTPTNAELAQLLSIQEKDIDSRTFHSRLVSVDLPYLIVPLTSQQAVRKARFSLDAWSQSSAPAMAAQEIFIFSGRTSNPDTDFHGRLLGPNIGAHEDPPIGSAMPCFAGYLGDHEHIREGTYTFAIDRGTPETRRSLLNIEVDY